MFPVPDGDTGTNMSMTLKSACEAVNAATEDSVEAICKAIASGSLRGARGNSGVIMSQILRGFTNHLKTEDEISSKLFFEAIQKAKETAYKAVVKPKEGTILTVIAALAEKAEEVMNSDATEIEKLEKVVAYGDEVLKKTPDMLPILKEAGVVDSGGQGLMYFAHGVLSYQKGEDVDIVFEDKNSSHTNINLKVVEDQDIKFGYCTECIINTATKFKENATQEIIEYLESIGDSLVVVGDDEYIKIHVHTNHPGRVFEKGLEYGFLTNLKVDNLKLEHQEKVIKDAEKKAQEFKESVKKEAPKTPVKLKEIGFVAVSSGDGLTTLFNDLGCDKVITGGQTMNPSTEDFIKAIEDVHAKMVFVFPNNSNIILAAKQAKEIIKDKEVYVIETKNVLQGINCLIYFTESNVLDDIINQFNDSIKNIKTIQTTYSIRDTVIDGIDIKENDFISLGDHGLLYTSKDIIESILGAYEKIREDKDAVVSIYYGDQVDEKEANRVKAEFESKYGNLDVSVYRGDQPVYYYYISIE